MTNILMLVTSAFQGMCILFFKLANSRDETVRETLSTKFHRPLDREAMTVQIPYGKCKKVIT